jgi:hypothetical protein
MRKSVGNRKIIMPDFGSERVKMDLQEVGCGGMDWTGLAQDTGR